MFKTFRMPAAVAAKRTISIPGRGSTVAVPCRRALAEHAGTLANMEGYSGALAGIVRDPLQQRMYEWLQRVIPLMRAYVDALRATCERMERTGIAEPLPPPPMLPVAPAGQAELATTGWQTSQVVWTGIGAVALGFIIGRASAPGELRKLFPRRRRH